MNEIVQHIPAFVETGDEPRLRVEFDSLDQLLAVPFVSNWATIEKEFHQFSYTGSHLIAELRGGREWWVIGSMRDPVPGLPEWNKGIYEVVDKDGKPFDVSGRDVSYSSGDDVGLWTGQVLKRAGKGSTTSTS